MLIVGIKVYSHWSSLAILMQQSSVNCPLHVKFDRFSWRARHRTVLFHISFNVIPARALLRQMVSIKSKVLLRHDKRKFVDRGQTGFHRPNCTFALAAWNTVSYKSDDDVKEWLRDSCLLITYNLRFYK